MIVQPQNFPDTAFLPEMVSQLAGIPVSALAMVCTVGTGDYAAVAAFITPKEARPAFWHAIEMECAYSAALLGFEDGTPPYYGESHAAQIKPDQAAALIGVDRVLCLVTQGEEGKISVTRDYDGLEVTLLESTNEQLRRFVSIMEDEANISTARQLQ